MKTLIRIVILLFIIQPVFSQNKRVQSNQLLITNKVTGKSIKIGAPEQQIQNFGGNLLNKKTLDPTIELPSHSIKYTYDNIIFFVSVNGVISTFETQSNEIAVERKGMFSFSPGDHLTNIANIFPNEVLKARITHRGIDRKEYIGVWIQLTGFNKNQNKYVDLDCKLGLLLNPETKRLEEIFYWIRP
jgi:hypothetical protein